MLTYAAVSFLPISTKQAPRHDRLIGFHNGERNPYKMAAVPRVIAVTSSRPPYAHRSPGYMCPAMIADGLGYAQEPTQPCAYAR